MLISSSPFLTNFTLDLCHRGESFYNTCSKSELFADAWGYRFRLNPIFHFQNSAQLPVPSPVDSTTNSAIDHLLRRGRMLKFPLSPSFCCSTSETLYLHRVSNPRLNFQGLVFD